MAKDKPDNRPSSAPKVSSAASYDSICWVIDNYQILTKYVIENDGRLDGFSFPRPDCFAYAMLVIDPEGGSKHLADMIRIKTAYEKSEKRQRSGHVDDDMRRQLSVLTALKAQVPVQLRPQVAGSSHRTDSGETPAAGLDR